MLTKILLQDEEKIASDTLQIAATTLTQLYLSDFPLLQEFRPFFYESLLPVLQYVVKNVNSLGDSLKLGLCKIIEDLEGFNTCCHSSNFLDYEKSIMDIITKNSLPFVSVVNNIAQKRKEQVQLIGKYKLLKSEEVLDKIMVSFQDILTVEALGSLEDVVYICQVRKFLYVYSFVEI